MAADLMRIHDDLLIRKWRHAHLAIEDHFVYITHHTKTLKASRIDRKLYKPRYVEYCKKRLAERLLNYVVMVRTLSEVEAEMRSRAIPFVHPSNQRGTLTC